MKKIIIGLFLITFLITGVFAMGMGFHHKGRIRMDKFCDKLSHLGNGMILRHHLQECSNKKPKSKKELELTKRFFSKDENNLTRFRYE